MLKRHETKTFELKNCFGKTYTLHRSEKFEQFLRELGAKKSVRIKGDSLKSKVTLSKQNDEYILTMCYPDLKDVIVKFKPKQTVERRRLGTVIATSVFYVKDNKVTERLQLGDRTVTIERIFTRKDLTITMEVNDVKCVRFFTLSSSNHSIETETSRRSSLWKTSTTNDLEILLSPESESVIENNTSETRGESEDVCF